MSNSIKKARRASEEPNFPAETSALLMAQYRQSILPPPTEMDRYEVHYPGITRELVTTYQKQVDHRIAIEKEVISSDIKRADRGQHYSFILIILMIVLSGALFFMGKDIAGAGVIIGALGGLIGTFITASIQRKNERQDKRKT